MTVVARQDGRSGETVLRRRSGGDGRDIFEIIVNGVFLMSSAQGLSERELAYRGLALATDGSSGELRVLIGGLGVGHTLAAVLEHRQVGHVEVVEIEPLIVEWAREHFGELNGEALDDERVLVTVDDLVHFVSATPSIYDAILIDIDNGPEWLVTDSNAALYGTATLERLRRLLHPGGVLGIWAAQKSPELLERLELLFANAEEHDIDETVEGRVFRYFIYFARR